MEILGELQRKGSLKCFLKSTGNAQIAVKCYDRNQWQSSTQGDYLIIPPDAGTQQSLSCLESTQCVTFPTALL